MPHLVLSRKLGERVMIGEDIVVEIAMIRERGHGRGTVRLKITAPAAVVVDREEIYHARRDNPGPGPGGGHP